MNDYLAIIIGVLSSFVASLVFLFLLTRIRPNIEISDKIAKNRDSTTDDVNYRIKIINKTSRSIINVQAQLHLISIIAVAGGMIEHNKKIALRTDKIMELSKFNLKDKNAEYAYRFIPTKNIEELWDDDVHSFLRFKISATDSLSGFCKVVKKDFHVKNNSIEEGVFEFGNSLDIK